MHVLALALFGCLASVATQERSQSEVAGREPRVRGRAADERGKPIEGVRIAVRARDARLLPALATPLATTDARGRFALTLPPTEATDDRRTLVLTATGWSTLIVGDGWLWHGLPTEAEVDLGDLVLLPGATLRGRVTTTGGHPLAGARVESRDPLASLVQSWRRHDAAYTTAAITGEDGSFALDGLPPGGTGVVVTADAHYRRELPFVELAESIAVTLTPSGFIEGVVKGEAGRPSPGASVVVHYAAGEDPGQHRAARDGRFRITRAFPHAYRIEAPGDGWRSAGLGYPVGAPRGVTRAGPVADLVLSSSAVVDPDRTLLLRATSAASGNALEAIRAATIWATPDILESVARDPRVALETNGARLHGPGEYRLPGPSAGQPTTGIVVVTAAGHAPLVLDAVQWSDADPPTLEAKLVGESVLTGSVVDARSREPVRGAMVTFVDFAVTPVLRYSSIALTPGADTTDDAGRFRLGGLRAGRYRLRAFLAGQAGAVVEVEVAAAATQADVELELPTGSSRLAGKLTGIAPATGWELRLRAHDASGVPWEEPHAGLAADGKFAITGLRSGSHHARLVLPHRGGRCGELALRLGELRVADDDLERDFDASEVRPGTIRGAVQVAGAPLSMHRLAVAAFAPPTRAEFLPGPYVVEPVGADGSFALPAVPGTHRIELIDLATRIPLAVVSGVQVTAGESTALPIQVELVPVRVHLQPDQEGSAIVASRLAVLVDHDAGVDVPFATHHSLHTDAGVILAGCAEDVDLLLPTRPTRLIVRSNHAFVHDGELLDSPPLGDAQLTPKKATADRVEIVVRTPSRPDRK